MEINKNHISSWMYFINSKDVWEVNGNGYGGILITVHAKRYTDEYELKFELCIGDNCITSIISHVQNPKKDYQVLLYVDDDTYVFILDENIKHDFVKALVKAMY